MAPSLIPTRPAKSGALYTVARIGNNGSSFHPHVHVGAFRGDMMSEVTGNDYPIRCLSSWCAAAMDSASTSR